MLQGLTAEEARAVITSLSVNDQQNWYAWRAGWDDWELVQEVAELLLPMGRRISGTLPDYPLDKGLLGDNSGLESESQADPGLELETGVRKEYTQPFIVEDGIGSGKREVGDESAIDVESVDLESAVGIGKFDRDNKAFERHKRFRGVEGSSEESSDEDLDIEVLDSEGFADEGAEFVVRNHPRHQRRLRVEITTDKEKVFKTYSIDVSVGGLQVEDSLPEWVAGYCQVRIVNEKKHQAIEVTCSIVENQPLHRRTRLEILPLSKKSDENHFEEWLAA